MLGQNQTTLWFQSPSSLPNYTPSFNYFVYHDSEGFVWISSTAGINRFDGKRIQHYSSDPSDSTSLYTGENIQSTFFEDREKNLWFTTGEAVHCYRRNTDNFLHIQLPLSEKLNQQTGYRAFFLEKDSFLWLTADSAIYRLNIRSPNSYSYIVKADESFYMADTLADGSVGAIYRKGQLKNTGFSYWVIDHGKLAGNMPWFDKTTKTTPKRVFDFISDSDSVKWLCTDKGLVKWNPQTRKYRIVGSLDLGECSAESRGKGLIMVWSKSKGLFLFNRNNELELVPITTRTVNGVKISSGDVYDIYLDRDENLWVSFQTSGVVYANLNKTKFRSLPKNPDKDGNSSYGYWSGLIDNEANFWHGSNTAGLFLLTNKGQPIAQYKHDPNVPSSLPNNFVTNLFQDDKQRLWVGTQTGIAWMDINRKGVFHQVFPLKKEDLYVIGIYQLKASSKVIVSTNGQGIFLVDESRGNPTLRPISLNRTSYGYIFEDSAGRIYSSQEELGIKVFQLQNERLQILDTLPLSNLITGYYETLDHKTLWISSFSGLIKVNLGNMKVEAVLLEKDGLPNKNIHSMLADDKENLWLSTPKGLALYSNKTGKFRHFSLADGTQSLEFQLLAAANSKSGELWFGGSNGITIVPNSPIDSVTVKPIVKVTGIKINDEAPFSLKDEITGATNSSEIKNLKLPYSQNTISFDFVAIEYSDPGNNQLRYKLEGEDENWAELAKGEPGFTRYSSLWKGKYTFWLQAANSDGVWGEPVAVMHIVIMPPFWARIDFLIGAFLALLGITIAIIRYRIAQIREKADLNTRVAENKMAALRSQMNPHFVFNSLQTVNGFIAKQDLRGAMEYINQFARLMRVILENSREGQISLEREVELLELYMKIESRRFGTPFTYTINVGDNVDTYSMEIPSMLLQPFVENAIKHGLFHKKEGGHINIAFLRVNGSLKCVVEDNGVGRAKTAELNTQQGRGHKSRGLQIVNERLAIIRAANPGNYDVKISDLFDRQQNPSGTRVEITLPLS